MRRGKGEQSLTSEGNQEIMTDEENELTLEQARKIRKPDKRVKQEKLKC